MPSLMPSLVKYFTIVGGVLVAVLIGLNAVLQAGGPGPSLIKEQPKVLVRHDPEASRVERLRAEEAALAAAKAKATTNSEAPQPVTVTEPVAPRPTTQAAVQPAEVSAAAALTTAPSEDEAAQAVRLAQEKIAAEKARKKRIARVRAKAQEDAASRQQDQIYYGYAPRPTYGPFGQGGGWQGGGGWGQRW